MDDIWGRWEDPDFRAMRLRMKEAGEPKPKIDLEIASHEGDDGWVGVDENPCQSAIFVGRYEGRIVVKRWWLR